jgi:uncharacterized membrane protein YhaH (DUF805 family)
MKKYFDFKGTATRCEYWNMYGLIIIATVIITALIMSLPPAVSGLITIIGIIGILWACLATSIRRLTDMGQSGWWALLLIVPYASFVFSIVIGCVPSAPV